MNSRTFAILLGVAVGAVACGKSGPDTTKGPDQSSAQPPAGTTESAPAEASAPAAQSQSAAPQRGAEEGVSHTPGAAGQNAGCDTKGMDTSQMSQEERDRTMQNCHPQGEQGSTNPASTSTQQQ